MAVKTKKAQPTAAQDSSPSKNIWVLLRKTKEKAARMGDQFSESLFLVDFYNEIQTHFTSRS